MNNDVLLSVSKNFDYLIPKDKETLLVLFSIFLKTERKELDDSFSQKEFDDTIDEVINLVGRDKAIQKEVLSKRLSQHFFTTLKGGSDYHFQLTVFAKELIKLLRDELQPQYENLELIHTFKRTLPLYEEDLESSEKFDYWFKHHYDPAQKVILSHTDRLQRYVDEKISELRTLLKPEIKKPRDLITRFLIIFEQLGRQTEGIIQTLNYKEDVVEKVKASETRFSQNRSDWERYVRIQSEINLFFENIDKRVLSINDKVQLTCSRLKSLYDTLRYKQEFKFRIEKFLSLLLRYSTVENGEIRIPDCIASKKIPVCREKFYTIPFIPFGIFGPRSFPDYGVDEIYLRKKEEENLRMLKRQESVSKWLNEMNGEISSGREVVFEEWFDKMVDDENNVEVPVDVCFGLIQGFNAREDHLLKVDHEAYHSKYENTALWKMKIKAVTG